MKQDRDFVFITGTSGSGTTMLLRMLSSHPQAVSFGGNFVTDSESPAFRSFVKRLDKATKTLWNTTTSFNDWTAAKEEARSLFSDIRSADAFRDITTFYFKRSCPFYRGDGHRPAFTDAVNHLGASKVIWIQRHPLDATFSSFQRGFCENLRHCANTQLLCLRHLSHDFENIDATQKLYIQYETLCASPQRVIQRISDFLGHRPEPYKSWVEQNPLKSTRRITSEGAAEQVRFLSDYWAAQARDLNPLGFVQLREAA